MSAIKIKTIIDKDNGTEIDVSGIAVDSNVLHKDGDEDVNGQKTFKDKAVFEADIEIQGTVTSVNTTDLEVKDKLITLNKGGNDSDNAGIEIEESGNIVATIKYNKTNGEFEDNNGKILSDNNYTNDEKDKVAVIDKDGDGTQYLANDGTYKEVSLDGKADKVNSATNGNFAGLDTNGNLTDSGKKADDFVLANRIFKTIPADADLNNDEYTSDTLTTWTNNTTDDVASIINKPDGVSNEIKVWCVGQGNYTYQYCMGGWPNKNTTWVRYRKNGSGNFTAWTMQYNADNIRPYQMVATLGTQDNPAISAEHLASHGINKDGFYYIATPNGGIREVYCIFDFNGAYMLIGHLDSSAKDTVRGDIDTIRERIDDDSGNKFSCNFGDYSTREIRFIGYDNLIGSNGGWRKDRKIDFIHGIDGKEFKNTIGYAGNPNGGRGDQVGGADATSGARYGYYTTYAKDGRGRWVNYKYGGHLMSDGRCDVSPDDFVAPASFNLNGADDAKFSVSHNKDCSGQDVNGANCVLFGADDNNVAMFDVYPNTEDNNSTKVDFDTEMYIFIR